MNELAELRAFVRVAESGSFSRVARELGVSQPSVSRMVAAIEGRLGVRLFLRSTRQVTLTDAGAAFLDRTRPALAGLDEAAEAARGAESLRGLLRVAVSGAFAVREVIPRLPGFLARHPALRVELLVSDRLEDLVAEGADMALRLGPLAASGFGARLLGTASRHLVAAPTYLAARGVPAVLAELAGHDCILGPGLSGERGWSFGQGGTAMSVAVQGRVRVSSAEGIVACARAGLGIGLVSRWMCRAELAAGALVTVLDDQRLAPVEVHAVYPAGPRPTLKVRAFADYLVGTLAG